MGERVSDQAYWLGANGIDDPEAAELVMSALVSPGDWGTVTVRREGRGKLVVGLVSTLVLADDEAEATFMDLLSERIEGAASA